MKSITLILGLLITAMSVTVGAQTVNESVTFDEKIHNFGEISETAGKVSHRFRFTNTGQDTVLMLHARAGCACVQAKVPEQAVFPGHSGYVTVTFDPEYRPGHFSKEIVVFSKGNKYNRIWVKGDVIPGVHKLTESYRYELGSGLLTRYRVMNFGKVSTTSPAKKTLALANDSTTTLRLDFITENATPEVSVNAGCILQPGQEASVEVIVAPTATGTGPTTVKLIPVANGRRLTPIDIIFTPDQHP